MQKNENLKRFFSKEEIESLLKLKNFDKVYKVLFVYNVDKYYKPMLRYLIRENIQIVDEIFKDNNLFKSLDLILDNYVRVYKNNNNSFKWSFTNIYEKISDFPITYFNNLIKVCILYQNNKLEKEELTNFINFHMEYLKTKAIHEEHNYDIKYDKYLYKVIIDLLSGKISIPTFINTLKINKVKNLVFNSMYNVKTPELPLNDKFSLNLLVSINPKKINNMYNIFTKYEYVKEYSKYRIILFLIRLSSILKEENTDNIIRHLPKEKEKFNNLYSTIMNLKNIRTDENNNIVYDDEFIKFFMGNNIYEPFSPLNLIYNNDYSIINRFDIIYNNFDKLNERFKNQTKLTRLKYIDKTLDNTLVLFNPDEYKLEGEVINTSLVDTTYQKSNSDYIIETTCNVYKKMKHKFQKTIPYIDMMVNGYHCRTLKANDENIFTVGSRSNNCFKVGGDGDSFLKYTATSLHGRVITISDKNDRLLAMIPIIRNGNVLTCNSIESSMIDSHDFMKKMFEVLEIIGQKMIEESEKYESEQEKISLLVVGNYKNNIENFYKYEVIDNNYQFKPILDYNQVIKTNLGVGAKGFYILSKKYTDSEKTYKLFTPNHIYLDERQTVEEVEIDMLEEDEKESIQLIINSINFELNKDFININDLIKIEYNEDWYIAMGKDFNLYSGLVGDDDRAKNEFMEYLVLEKEYIRCCKEYFDDTHSYIEKNQKI